MSDLSGGERRRLQLLRILMAEPNVLLMDEPTNDLDIETLTSLEDVLDSWAGTLLVVSHDRYLLERMCDLQVALMGDGTIRQLPGGVEQYLQLRETQRAQRPPVASSAAPPAPAEEQPTGEPSPGRARELRKELARIEKALARIEQRQGSLHAQMAQAATDHARIAELNVELQRSESERAELEAEWLEIADEAG